MSFKILFFCLLLNNAVFCKRGKIIGGRNAEIAEFPHQVSLRIIDTNVHGCGGTIISERHVLTAAHCFKGLHSNYQQIGVYAGSRFLSTTYRRYYRVEKVDIHPRYTGTSSDDGTYVHDIAIITVQEPIVFDHRQNKIDLPTGNVPNNANATVTGWGYITFPGRFYSETLQKSWTIVMTNVECMNTYDFIIHHEQLCAYNDYGVGLCIGDSGGGLIYDGKIIGISSFILPCASGYPDVFTNVYRYRNFIRSVTGI